MLGTARPTWLILLGAPVTIGPRKSEPAALPARRMVFSSPATPSRCRTPMSEPRSCHPTRADRPEGSMKGEPVRLPSGNELHAQPGEAVSA